MTHYSHIDILQLEKYHRISLINKISGLRSANLLGTKNEKGITNLAIFNSVIHVGANPPLLGFLMRPITVERHTYSNIKNSGLFTINQVNESIHQKAHQTSAKFGPEESEFEKCGLAEEYIGDFSAPFVQESKIKIGLSFVEEQNIQANGTVFIVGQIEQLTIDSDSLNDEGDVLHEELKTVAISGLDSYYSCQKLGRYSFARPNEVPVKLL